MVNIYKHHVKCKILFDYLNVAKLNVWFRVDNFYKVLKNKKLYVGLGSENMTLFGKMLRWLLITVCFLVFFSLFEILMTYDRFVEIIRLLTYYDFLSRTCFFRNLCSTYSEKIQGNNNLMFWNSLGSYTDTLIDCWIRGGFFSQRKLMKSVNIHYSLFHEQMFWLLLAQILTN